MELNTQFVQVLADLKFISNIKPGDIVYVGTKKISSRSLFSTFYRRYLLENEGGQATVSFITTTLSKTYSLINTLRKSENTSKYVEHLIDHLEMVKNAINNLKETYKDYPFIDASFDALLIEITRSLEIYKGVA